jgi:hypothetical protein
VGWMMVTFLPITWLLKPLVWVLFGVNTALTCLQKWPKISMIIFAWRSAIGNVIFYLSENTIPININMFYQNLKTWTLHLSKWHKFIGLPPQMIACFVLPPNFCIQNGVVRRHHIADLSVQ